LMCQDCSQLFEMFHPTKRSITLVNSQNALEVKLANHYQFSGTEHECGS
jgi:hypothetical protein